MSSLAGMTFRETRMFGTHHQGDNVVITRLGLRFSAAASAAHHCIPRNDWGPYVAVEVGFWGEPPKLPGWAPYLNHRWRQVGDVTLYSYVPVRLVYALIRRYGGEIDRQGHGHYRPWVVPQTRRELRNRNRRTLQLVRQLMATMRATGYDPEKFGLPPVVAGICPEHGVLGCCGLVIPPPRDGL